MGKIQFGFPERHAIWLKERLNLEVFVEGGTYQGNSALRASEYFKKVYTIEKSDVMYELARAKLDNVGNIFHYKGDTREHLPKILKESPKGNIFWLDAHWSGGDTYGANDECPLIKELHLLFQSELNFQENVILIDDARLFLSPPPLPHVVSNWPLLSELINITPKDLDFLIFDDVIYIVPKDIEFREYIQLQTKTNLQEGIWVRAKKTIYQTFSKFKKIR